jgi:phenylacetate-CoA ligase
MESIPQSDSADVLRRMYDGLMHSQHSAQQALAAHQQTTLRHLVNHAMESTDFYRRRLSHLAGNDGGIDFDKWSSVEPIGRADLIGNYDRIIARAVPENHGHTRLLSTSGSTGAALKIPRTAMTDIADNAALYRHYTTNGVDCSRPLAQIRVFDTGLRRLETAPLDREHWAPPWTDKAARGRWHRLSVFTPVDRQVGWIEEIEEPCYLNTFPSNITRLAEYLKKEQARLDNIAAVFTVGEPVTEAIRAACQTYLNCEAIDLFSSAECGLVATQCPAGAGYHVQSEICLAEVLRDDGTSCHNGEAGHLTVTPFYNFALPLIRYRTGDVATLGPQCSCGRTLPVLESPITHAANQIDQGPGGRWSVPDGFADGLTGYLGPCPWQIVQTESGSVELRYSRPAGTPPADEAGAAHFLASRLTADLDVQCTEVDIVGRGPSGKFPQIVRLSASPA